jgi:hypothetical protein
LAKRLAAQQATEAGIRTAISRLYYAAHLTARQKAWEKGWVEESDKPVHARVISSLRRKNRAQGDRLDLLRECREHSDYHLDAKSGPSNHACKLCEQTRRSGSMEDRATTAYWEYARDIYERLMPLLDKL